MQDWTTRQIVSHILSKIGYNLLSDFVKKNDVDLYPYIEIIEHKSKGNHEIQELVNYFL